jgi:predicted nucleotidyltransferase
MLNFIQLQRPLKNILKRSIKLIQCKNLTIYVYKLDQIVLDDAPLGLQ